MLIKKTIKYALPVLLSAVAACSLSACGDDSSSSPSGSEDSVGSSSSSNKKDNTNPTKVCWDESDADGCNFKVDDKVWFYFGWMGVSERYTWIDDTTVEYVSCMNAYHLDDDDKTLTNQNRQELYEEVKSLCETSMKMKNENSEL